MPTTDRTMLAAAAAAFVVVLDNTKVNVALPTLATQLHGDESTLQWIVQAYVLAFAAPLLLSGGLADRYGRHRTLRVGLLAFAAASALAAAAPSTGLLISARIGTGLAAALVMPATLAAVSAAAPTPQRRTKAVAGWTAVVALAVAVGPPVGGVLLAVTGWPILFWINVPLALAAALLLPRATDADPDTTRLDVRGSLLLTGFVLGIVTAATELPRAGWTGAPVVAGACAAVACATAYAFHQRRGAPILPLAMFRQRRLRTAAVVLAAMFGALFGIAFLVPQYLQVVRGDSPLTSGLLILPYALALTAGSLAAGALPARWRATLVVAGLVATAAVHAIAAVGLAPRTPTVALVVGLAVIGVGIGLAQPVLTDAVLASAGDRAGLGSALNDAIREVGGVTGVAVLGSIAAAAGPLVATAMLTGIRWAAAAAALLLLIAAALAHSGMPLPAHPVPAERS